MIDDSFGMDANLTQPNLPPALVQFDQTCERIAMGLVGARVRTRALIELLEEKGVLGGSDFDQRAEAIWERDYDALSGELLAPLESPPEEAEQAAGAQPTPSPLPNPSQYYTGALLNFVDDAVAGRVRLRRLSSCWSSAASSTLGSSTRRRRPSGSGTTRRWRWSTTRGLTASMSEDRTSWKQWLGVTPHSPMPSRGCWGSYGRSWTPLLIQHKVPQDYALQPGLRLRTKMGMCRRPRFTQPEILVRCVKPGRPPCWRDPRQSWWCTPLHEAAHLRYGGHGPRFWTLLRRRGRCACDGSVRPQGRRSSGTRAGDGRLADSAARSLALGGRATPSGAMAR